MGAVRKARLLMPPKPQKSNYPFLRSQVLPAL